MTDREQGTPDEALPTDGPESGESELKGDGTAGQAKGATGRTEAGRTAAGRTAAGRTNASAGAGGRVARLWRGGATPARETAATPSETAVRINDWPSQVFVIAVVGVFVGIFLYGLLLGSAGLFTPLPTPSPSPSASPAASAAPGASPTPFSSPVSPSPAPSGSAAPSGSPAPSASASPSPS